MKAKSILLLSAALLLAICSSNCTNPRWRIDQCERLSFSAAYVTCWTNAGKTVSSRPLKTNSYSDLSYILKQENDATWSLSEQSVRVEDAGIHHIYSYGNMKEDDAQLILSAFKSFEGVRPTKINPTFPPGGPSERALYESQVKVRNNYYYYESSDADNAAQRNILSVFRQVAKKYGPVLPITDKRFKHM